MFSWITLSNLYYVAYEDSIANDRRRNDKIEEDKKQRNGADILWHTRWQCRRPHANRSWRRWIWCSRDCRRASSVSGWAIGQTVTTERQISGKYVLIVISFSCVSSSLSTSSYPLMDLKAPIDWLCATESSATGNWRDCALPPLALDCCHLFAKIMVNNWWSCSSIVASVTNHNRFSIDFQTFLIINDQYKWSCYY